jgi:hypothetical protein
LAAATPAIARGGELGARRLLATGAGNVLQSPIARAVGEEIGAQGALFAADAAGQVIQGQNPLSKENLFANVVSNVASLPVTAPMMAARLRADPQTKLSPYQTEVIMSDISKMAENGSALRAAQQELHDYLNVNPNEPILGAADTMLAQVSNSADYRKLVANSRLDPNGTLNLTALDTEWVLKNDPQYQALKRSYEEGGAQNNANANKLKTDLQTQSKNNSINDEARWLEYWTARTPKSEGVVQSSKVPLLEGPDIPKSVLETAQYIDVQDGNLRSALVNLFSQAEASRVLKPKETVKPAEMSFSEDAQAGLAKGFEADNTEMLRAQAEYEQAYQQLAPKIEELNAEVQTKQVRTVDDAFDLPKVVNASVDMLNKWFKTTGRFQSVKVPEQLGSIFEFQDGRNVITAESIQRTLGKHIEVEGNFEGAVQRVVQQIKNEYQTKLNDYLTEIKSAKKTETKPLKASDFADAEQKAITDAYSMISNRGEFAQRALDRVMESYMNAKTEGQNPNPSMITKNLQKLLGSEKMAEAKTKSRRKEISTETPLGENMTLGDTVANRPAETSSGVNEKAASVQGSLDEIVKAADFEKRVARVTELTRASDVKKAVNQMRAVYELIQEGVIQPNKIKSAMSEDQIARFQEKLKATGFDSDIRSAGPLIKRSLDRLRAVLEDAGVRGFGETTGVVSKGFDEIINELNSRRNPQVQLASDVNVFFNKFLDELGMEPALKEQYLATAQRVAQAYGNLHETRLVELQQKIGRDGLTGEVLQTMGLFVPMGPRFANTTTTTRNLVALVGNKMVSKQLEPFLKISALGHELFHALANNLKVSGIDAKRLETLERMNAFANDLSEAERRQIAQSLTDIMIPKRIFGQNDNVLKPMLDYVSKSGEEFTAFYAQMLSVGLASRTRPERRGFLQKLKQFFTFSSQFEADFGQGIYRNLSEMTDMLKAGLDSKQVKPEVVSGIVDFQKDLKSLMRTPEQMQRAADFMQNLVSSYDPQVSLEKLTNSDLRNAQALKLGTGAKEFFDEYLADPSRVYSKGRKLGTIQNKFGNPFQAALEVASFIPAARDFIATVYDTQSKVNLFRQTQMLDFMVRDVAGQWTTIQATGGKKLNEKQTRTFNAVDLVETNPAASKAFSDIARFHNEEGQAGRGKLFTSDELAAKVPSFAKLNPQMKSDVMHLVELTTKSNQVSANLIVDNTNFILSQNVARIIQYKNTAIGWEQANQLGQYIRAAAQDAHAQGLAGPNAEAFIIQRIGDTKGADVSAAIKQAVRQSPIVTEIATHLTSRPWYFNEQRVGDYLITYQTKDGQRGTIGAANASDVRTKRAQLMKDGIDMSTIQVAKKSEMRDNNRVQLGEETLKLFQKLEQAAFDEALKNVGPEAAELLKAEYNPGDVSLIALQKQQAKDYEKPRALAAGRDYLNIWESSVNYYNRLSHSLANQRMKAATEVMLNDPKFKENPEIQKRFSEYRDSVLAPVARSPHVENAVFTYFLGFNASSALMNLSQNVMILPTQLISNGAGIVDAHNLVKNASWEISQAYRAKGLSRGEVRFEDAELNKHFQQAVAEGFLRNGAFTDLLNNEELLAVNTKRLRDGKKGLTAGELLGNSAHLFFKGSRWLFSATESANAQIGFVAGWKLGKQKGLAGDKLYAFAKEQSRAANFSGGKYNRPFGFYKLGNLQGVGSAVMALQNFTIANFSMMSRLFKDSIGSTGLTGAEKTQARKAFATMLTAQAAGAGLLGLPLAGAMMQIVEDVFGTEVVAPTYEAIASLAGDDQELGSTIADIAMNGMANQMLKVDVGSRLGQGSLGPFNAYNGFELKSLFGATGGLVKNIYDGVKQISQDGVTLDNPIIPSGIRKPLELYANKGNFTDRQGNLLMEPNQAEQVAYFFGFNPKELSDIKQRDRLMRQADLVSKNARRKEYEGFANMLLEGNPTAVRQALLERQQSDSTFDIESAYRSIVDIAVQRTLPDTALDRGSEASAGRRQQIANVVGPKTPRALEVAKAQIQSALLSALNGRPVMPNNRELLKNQVLDQILQQNPTMPRALALRLVERQLGTAPQMVQ